MITGEVIRQAAVIAAAMAVATALIDIVNEQGWNRGVRLLANFVLLSAFTLGLEYLLGGSAAVVATLTH